MFPSRRIATINGDVFRDETSLSFDGTNDRLNFGDVTALDGLDDITISMWIKYKDTNTQVFISKGDYNSSGFEFNLDPGTSDGRMRFSVGASASSGGYWYRNSLALAGTCEINKWNHVAVSYSNTNDTIFFYINGVEWAPTSTGGSFIAIPDVSDNLKIGTDSSGNQFTYGNISDTAIYNTNLSRSQINMIYNGREPYNHKEGSLSKNLVSWWRMGDGNFDRYPLITDSFTTTSFGTDLITNGTFDSNVTGWSDNDGGGGGAVTHETSTKYSGAGSAKITWPDPPTDYCGMMTASNVSSVQANTLYLIEAYIYIPSGWDGGDVFVSEGATFGSSSSEQYVKASSSITNQWQLTKTMFRTASDTAGKLYFRASSTPSATKYIFVDSVTMRAVTGGIPAHTVNMTTTDFVGDTP